ncbi:MAG: TIGR03564 family F420-dependent LLM class oxidoreductase [Dehalococcoidia bacterium]|nr:TIGR03564 family F420-dependent LLM class oxidoreductase [Dehalococcoidia bacterium]
MRIGVGVDLQGELSTVLENIQRVEAQGFATVWVPQLSAYDAITLLALAGRVTSRVELGTFVVPSYPRHPVALASQALTAAAATDGRFTLGLGLSHRIVVEDALGLDYSKPIRHMREYLSVLGPLLRGEAVRFKGDEFRVASQITVPGARPPQLLVAALGPQMLKVAGRLADGTCVWMGNVRYLSEVAMPALTDAAREAGRPAPRVVAGFPVAITADVEAARASAAKSFVVYGQIPSYRATLDRGGAEGPADIAIVGSEEDVVRQLRELAGLGVTDVNATPFRVQGDPEAPRRTVEFLAGLAKSGL